MIDTAAVVRSYRDRRASNPRRVTPEAIARGPAAAARARHEKGRAAYATIAATMRELRREGLTLGAIADALNNAGHPTRYGSRWDAANVRRVIALYA